MHRRVYKGLYLKNLFRQIFQKRSFQSDSFGPMMHQRTNTTVSVIGDHLSSCQCFFAEFVLHMSRNCYFRASGQNSWHRYGISAATRTVRIDDGWHIFTMWIDLWPSDLEHMYCVICVKALSSGILIFLPSSKSINGHKINLCRPPLHSVGTHTSLLRCPYVKSRRRPKLFCAVRSYIVKEPGRILFMRCLKWSMSWCAQTFPLSLPNFRTCFTDFSDNSGAT